MSKYEENLIKTIAQEHNISAKTLKDILVSSKNFTYENTTVGKRQSEYEGLISFAIKHVNK